MSITNEETMSQTQITRQRIAAMLETNRLVQSLHPEAATVTIFGLVKRQVDALTRQLVSELEQRLTDTASTIEEAHATE